MRRFLTNRWPELLGLSLLAIVGLAFGMPSGAAPGAARSAPARVLEVAVEVVHPATGYRIEQSYTGTLRARQDSHLALETGGRVVAVHADVGERVRAGEPLVEVDLELLTAQRSEFDSRLQAARASLDELVAGPRAEVIQAARALRDQRRAELELARLELGRRRELVDRAVESQAQLDAAATQVATAEALLRQSEAQLLELEEGTRKEVLAAQRARVRELEASLQRLDVQIADATLAAPFDGVIAERLVDPGAVVAVGTVVLRLIETGHLEAWIGVPPEVADAALSAERLDLRLGAQQLTWTSRRLLPQIEASTRTATLVLDLAATPPDGATESPASGNPRPGDLVRLGFDRAVTAAGYWVPLEALVPSARGLWSCKVVVTGTDGSERIARAELEVLHTDGERAYVRGTLQDGDRVVRSGVQRVVAGQEVRVLDDATEPERRR
jgi:RND family efflux transporter MFP subunit